MSKRILIVGDAGEIAELFGCSSWTAEFSDLPAHYFSVLAEAIPVLNGKSSDCLVLAVPELSVEATDTLECVQAIDADLPVVVVSRRASPAEAVRLVRSGAFNCFGPG